MTQVIVGYERLIASRLEAQVNTQQKMGDIFKDIATFLKTYTQYVTDYTKAQSMLAAQKKNEELQVIYPTVCVWCLYVDIFCGVMCMRVAFECITMVVQSLLVSLIPEGERRGLKDFLIMPVQVCV